MARWLSARLESVRGGEDRLTLSQSLWQHPAGDRTGLDRDCNQCRIAADARWVLGRWEMDS